MSFLNARDVNTECQTAFFDIQYEFRKPQLRGDETLQGMLKEIGELNILMSENVLKTANSGIVGRIDNGFMEDLTELEDRISDHIWKMKRRVLLGKEDDSMQDWSEPYSDEGSPRKTFPNGDVRNRGFRPLGRK